ncbi:hypothetical protein A4X13_0g2912 [Tilletia indica]|uniref:Uncharacterized protein n=1 Tax=Tilletia indica TaxID=43049 RepID=A0A177TPZ7_9BASI|nr:hypothetical protein A4X13_0g2912 [Tilletia indica]
MQIELTLSHLTAISLLTFSLLILIPLCIAIYNAAIAPSKVAHYPGPGLQHWFLGSFPTRHLLTGKTVQAMHEGIKVYGRVFGMVHVGRQPVVLVADYGAASQVFLKESSRWPKSVSNIHLLRRFVGRGLLTEEGPVHRRQRKVAFPAFTKEAVNAMAADMLEKCELLNQRLGKLVDDSPSGEATTNIVEGWNKMALDIIARVGFGYDLNSLLDQGSILEDAYDSIMKTMFTASLYASVRHRIGPRFEQLGRWARVPEQVELDNAKAAIGRVSRELVERAKNQYANSKLREKEGRGQDEGRREGNDLLSLMVKANMNAELKSHQRLSDEELMAMVPTFLFAGHETSTASLAWASLALTQPGHGLQVQSRLRHELNSHPSNWRTSADDLDSIPYLDAVARETLRLHAPVRYLSRTAAQDEILRLGRKVVMHGEEKTEVLVRKGVQVTFPLQYMNCDPEVWGEDGHEFRPERWLAEDHEHYSGSVAPTPEIKAVWSSLMTFGLGPNNCIGQRVAILELKMGLAAVLSEFEFLPLEQGPPPFDFLHGIVARPVVVGQEEKGIQVPIRIRRARVE